MRPGRVFQPAGLVALLSIENCRTERMNELGVPLFSEKQHHGDADGRCGNLNPVIYI